MLRLHSYEDDKNFKTTRYTKNNFEVWSQNGAKGEYKTTINKFSLMAGFDLQKNDTDETSYDIVDGSAPRGGTDGDLLAKYETEETVKALYGEVKHQTTESLVTTLNLRYDDIEHKYKDEMDSANNVNPDYQTLSYRLGANYTINNNLSLYTSVSTGFRTPTVGQISQNQVSLAANPTLDIPSEIDVETTYNYEIGLRGQKGIFNFNASIFQIDRKDYIGRIAGSYISSDDEDESNYDNVGDMRSRGLELALGSDDSKQFSFDLAYTFLQAKFTDYWISQQITEDTNPSYSINNAIFERTDFSGNYVSRSPKHTVNLTFNIKSDNGNFVLSPEFVYKGSYYADEANQFKQGGYTVVNLRSKFKYSKNLEFFGKIDNLFDKNYYQFVNVNSSALATMEDATIRVAAPRAYYAGIRYKF
jgi:iron complex outermembrane receptor protein